MGTVLITGANRGIGLEHAKAYAEQGWRVLACARQPESAAALTGLRDAHPAQVALHALDVTAHAAVDALADELSGEAIDLLLNNAGTFGPKGAPEGMAYQGLEHMDYEIWRQMLEVNLLGAFKVAVAFAPHLRRAQRPVLVNMSSDLGAMSQNTQGGAYAYRTTKAGLNMITKGMGNEWPGIIVISMAPGWCKTDLGGEIAPIDPAESVKDQQRTIAGLKPEHSGRFLDRFGAEVAW